MTGTRHTRHVEEPRVLDSVREAPIELVLGRYRILSHCGTGGMSRVYRALDLRTSTIVAVKIISIIQDRQRTQREVEAIESIDHPNVVKMLDKGACRSDYVLSGKIKLWRSLSSDAQCRDAGGVFEVIAQMLNPDPLQRLPTAIVGAQRLRMTLAGSDAVPRPRAYDQTDRLVAASNGAALDYR